MLEDLKNMLGSMIRFLFGIAAPIAVILLIIAGIRYATAGGEPRSIASVKSFITLVIVGLLLILGSFWIFNSVVKLLGGSP